MTTRWRWQKQRPASWKLAGSRPTRPPARPPAMWLRWRWTAAAQRMQRATKRQSLSCPLPRTLRHRRRPPLRPQRMMRPLLQWTPWSTNTAAHCHRTSPSPGSWAPSAARTHSCPASRASPTTCGCFASGSRSTGSELGALRRTGSEPRRRRTWSVAWAHRQWRWRWRCLISWTVRAKGTWTRTTFSRWRWRSTQTVARTAACSSSTSPTAPTMPCRRHRCRRRQIVLRSG
mmetsp:Transcript_7345/g.23147  ORF Transcript_7345/g.23147 Transcript_7345/m.23147 type:complete len:231 (+) Transcript_7345:89-781(+)